MLRAVLFDLGDTLVDFEPMDTRAVFREGAWSTYEFLQRQPCARSLPPFERYHARQFRSLRWTYLWAKLRRREFNGLELLRGFCQGLGVTLDRPALLELAWLWFEPLTRRCSIEEGLADMLAALRRSGLELAIVSNTFVAPEVHDRHLADLGLLPFFSARVYSSEIGYRKPNPRIYQTALDRLGVPAMDAAFVGDLVKTDVVGARRLGMPTILKQPWGTAKRHRLAEGVIARLADLPDALRRFSPPPNDDAPQRRELVEFPVATG